MHGLKTMPVTMRQLAWVQFFTWLGLFCMWIYFSPAIARHIFGAVRDTPEYAALVAEAGQWTGVCFSLYNAVCFLFSFILLALSQRFSAKLIHVVCLLIGGAGLLSVFIAPSKEFLLLSMAGVGIAWASILSMPYAMLSNSLPAEKMGFYMGIFNFFIVLPQITVALGFGRLVQAFPQVDSLFIVMGGGGAMILAALLTLRVTSSEASPEPVLPSQAGRTVKVP